MNNQIIQRLGNILALVVILILGLESHAWARPSPILTSHLRIPILGTSINQHHRLVGLVSQIVIDLSERRDHNGLQVQFHTEPGQFSLLARKAIHQAITRAFHVANLPSSSWTVLLRFPYRGLTIYGERLSAMVGLSVVAMVKGDVLLEGRILTGTITDEGYIGSVSGLQLKILAAYRQHFQRVFIPSDYDIEDGDWRTPFLMHVSPVSTINEAYLGLTGHQLVTLP